MDHNTVVLLLSAIFGFFMAWGVGANDVSNAMGTAVGSQSLTLKQAIVIAVIFEALGAVIAGGEVTQTIRGQIIDMNGQLGGAVSGTILINGMLASLLAAGIWLLIATCFGWPVSTTHSLVGALVGFATVCLGPDSVYWGQVAHIALGWIVTPIIAGLVAYLLFLSVQVLIFRADNVIRNACRYIPIYIFLVAFVIGMVTTIQGFKLPKLTGFTIAVFSSGALAVFGGWLLKRLTFLKSEVRREQFQQVEKMFGFLMIFTAAAMAFAHGSNDVSNAIGPVAAVITLVENPGQVMTYSPLPTWLMMLGAAGIILGIVTFGYKVIATIGTRITQLTPSRGFAAQLSTASTVVIASSIGMPVSTTQVMVGAVLGVGIARGIAALNLTVIRNIFMSWIITLPAGALLSILVFYFIQWIFD